MGAEKPASPGKTNKKEMKQAKDIFCMLEVYDNIRNCLYTICVSMSQ